MKVIFKSRDFSYILAELPLTFEVERYSHSVFGGPKYAEISITGSDNDLWEMIERIRCPVEIYGDNGECVWWGYVSEVDLSIGKVNAGVTIDSMANCIAVAYTTVAAGSNLPGERATTEWGDANISQDEYGIKQLLLTSSGTTEEHAQSAMEMALASREYPQPTITFGGGGGVSKVYCRGWYSTLGWRYASVPVLLAWNNFNDGTTDKVIGKTTGTEKLAQGFYVGYPVNAAAIEIYVRKVGNPTDNLTLAFYTRSEELTIGTLITSGDVSGSDLAVGYSWARATFDSETLNSAAYYFLVVERDGDLSDTDYYEIRIDGNQALPFGEFMEYTSSEWESLGAKNMPFRIYTDAIVRTSEQVKTMAASYGQFFANVLLEVDSGISTESFRDGDGTALYEIEELLKMGTVNKRRMLATVDVNRYLRITEEPTNETPYLITKGGELRGALDNPINAEACPVGVWMRLKDVIPSSVDVSLLADPTMAFIDEAEYNARTGVLQLTPRNIEDPWEIGVPRDG